MKLYAEPPADESEKGRGQAQPARLSAEELCGLYADRVYQFATMIARDDVEADDLAQIALERALRASRGVTNSIQEPTDRGYGIDTGIRDRFGNAIRILQPRAGPRRTCADDCPLAPTATVIV